MCTLMNIQTSKSAVKFLEHSKLIYINKTVNNAHKVIFGF